MELKFRIKDFQKIKKLLRSSKAELIDKRVERYYYLRSGDKLQVTKGKYYHVSIKKKGTYFELTYKLIDKNVFKDFMKVSKVTRRLVNKRQIYRIDRVDVSLNEMNIGKFVIFDGKKNDVAELSKEFKMRNIVKMPFSEL